MSDGSSCHGNTEEGLSYKKKIIQYPLEKQPQGHVFESRHLYLRVATLTEGFLIRRKNGCTKKDGCSGLWETYNVSPKQ